MQEWAFFPLERQYLCNYPVWLNSTSKFRCSECRRASNQTKETRVKMDLKDKHPKCSCCSESFLKHLHWPVHLCSTKCMIYHYCCCYFEDFCCGFIKRHQSVTGMKLSGSLNAVINSFTIKQLIHFPSPTSMKTLLRKRKDKILLV